MKRVIMVPLLLVPLGLLTQELKLSGTIGYSVTEADRVKKVALCNGIEGGAEFRFGWRWNIIVSGGGFRLRYEHTNAANVSVFNTRYFASLPVHLRKNYKLSSKSFLYMDIGIATAYQFLAKEEIRNAQATNLTRKRNLGFNFGGLVAFGFKTTVSKNLFFEIGLLTQKDFLYSYKDNPDKTKTTRTMLQIGFSRKSKK